jgi:hypothetical protein
MTWKRRGGRKVIIAPDGGDAWAPAKQRPDETLIRALVRAHRWKWMLEDGRYWSACEIAEAKKVEGMSTGFYGSRCWRRRLILDGQQPKGMRLEELTRAEWVGRAARGLAFNQSA